MQKFFKKYWFTFSIIFILILSITLRFYNYPNRWGLSYDQAHDVLSARGAIQLHKLPILGPFSSAGAFVTGPEWYWFIIIGILLYYPAVIAPWTLLTALFIVAVFVMIKTGELLNGKLFGLLLGLLTAVSSSEIAQSINLTNQAPLALLSVTCLFLVTKYFKTGKLQYVFFLGLAVGLGIVIHLQGVLLGSLLILIFLFRKFSFKHIVVCYIGFVIPFIPLALFDLTHHFYNFGNMLQYYLHDQYKVSLAVLGRNWKNYIITFWPKAWSYVIGGNILSGSVLIIVSFTSIGYALYKKNISRIISIFILNFFIAFIFLRYTRTPLFDSYLMFLHAHILLIAAFGIWYLYRFNKFAGAALLILIVICSLQKDIMEIKNASNKTALQSQVWKQILVDKYPNQKFAIYDYQYKTTAMSLPLSLFLDGTNKISNQGYKIGLVDIKTKMYNSHKKIWGADLGWQLVDLQSSSSAALNNSGWQLVTPQQIYHTNQEWFVNKNL